MSANIYKSLLEEPLDGGDPLGVNARNEEIFFVLQDEIDKISSVTSEEPVDWKKIKELSEKILRKSKDLLAASYLCVALTFLKDGKNLSQAILGLKAMLATWNEELYPKRERAKIAALKWMANKTAPALESEDLAGLLRADELKELRSGFKALEAASDDIFGDSSVDFYPALQALDKLELQAAPAEEPEAEPPKEEPPVETSEEEQNEPEASPAPQQEKKSPLKAAKAAEKPQEKKTAAIPDAGLSEELDEQALRTFLDNLKTSARALRSADPSDYRSYKLVRLAVWGQVETAPPHNDGETPLPPPKFYSDLGQLAASGLWEDLLEASEDCAYDYAFTFCLDIHRYSALALSNLGESYKDAKEAVTSETLSFLKRLPEIENLFYAGEYGAPFASQDTKAWLAYELKTDVKDENSSAPALGGAKKSPAEKTLERAEKIALNPAEIPRAAKIIQRRIDREGSAKAQTWLRAGLNKILSGREEYALQILANSELILENAEKHQLAAWDKEFALKALISARDACLSMRGEVFENLADDIAKDIAGIDVAASLDN